MAFFSAFLETYNVLPWHCKILRSTGGKVTSQSFSNICVSSFAMFVIEQSLIENCKITWGQPIGQLLVYVTILVYGVVLEIHQCRNLDIFWKWCKVYNKVRLTYLGFCSYRFARLFCWNSTCSFRTKWAIDLNIYSLIAKLEDTLVLFPL